MFDGNARTAVKRLWKDVKIWNEILWKCINAKCFCNLEFFCCQCVTVEIWKNIIWKCINSNWAHWSHPPAKGHVPIFFNGSQAPNKPAHGYKALFITVLNFKKCTYKKSILNFNSLNVGTVWNCKVQNWKKKAVMVWNLISRHWESGEK